MKLIIVFIFLVGCVKDYNFNPYTTAIQQLIKSEKLSEKKKLKLINEKIHTY